MLFNRVPCFFYNHLKNKPSFGASCISNKIIIYDKLKKNIVQNDLFYTMYKKYNFIIMARNLNPLLNFVVFSDEFPKGSRGIWTRPQFLMKHNAHISAILYLKRIYNICSISWSPHCGMTRMFAALSVSI